jgi:large conductance mechanosensitive channel
MISAECRQSRSITVVKAVIKDFKDFVLESDFVALATGLIVGATVGKIVTSVVNDLVMPAIGAVTKGTTSFTNLRFVIPGTSAVVRYGNFLSVLLDAVIVLFVVFLIIRGIEKLRRLRDTDEDAAEKDCPYCLTAIPCAATRCPACTSHLETEGD